MTTDTLETVNQPDESLGVKASPVDSVDHPIVDRDRRLDNDEPRPEIAALSPGDRIQICDVECTLFSAGKHVENGRHYLYRLGIPPEAFGTVATLYVDRDPYLLDVCNGDIYVVDPDEVTVQDS